MSRLKVIIVSLLAVMAVGVTAAASQAAEPEYESKGAALTGELSVKGESLMSRLVVPAIKIMIVCTKDTVTGGKITVKGEDSATSVLYLGCKVFETAENLIGQLEEGQELTVCKVKSVGGVLEEIKTSELKSKLVYVVGKELVAPKEVLNLFEPKTVGGAFVELVIEGASCAAKTTKTSVLGKVLGKVPRINEEAIMGDLLFEVVNGGSIVTQRYTEYELNAVKTTGIKLMFGTNPAVLETTEQVELEPTGTGATRKRGLYEVHG